MTRRELLRLPVAAATPLVKIEPLEPLYVPVVWCGLGCPNDFDDPRNWDPPVRPNAGDVLIFRGP